MRIATFNIWNKDIEWESRIKAIRNEIERINPDIVALQEVRSTINSINELNVAQYICDELESYQCVFKEYPDSPDEGLAFLSKIPVTSINTTWNTDTLESNYCAIRITINHDNVDYGITNVHLNWRTEEIRQQQITFVNDWISANQNPYEILCGDFNDLPFSNTYEHLIKDSWYDVAILDATKNDTTPQSTLDFEKNRYLKENNESRESVRYDWIFMKNDSNVEALHIESVEVFGSKLTKHDMVLPSDHYGVLTEFK